MILLVRLLTARMFSAAAGCSYLKELAGQADDVEDEDRGSLFSRKDAKSQRNDHIGSHESS